MTFRPFPLQTPTCGASVRRAFGVVLLASSLTLSATAFAQTEGSDAGEAEGVETSETAPPPDDATAADGAGIEAVGPVAPDAPPAPSVPAAPKKVATESNCTDGLDDDNDTVFDCADADCAEDAACQPGGSEGDEASCSDWIDNDGDGFTDCDDVDCQLDGIQACQGSWAGPVGGQVASSSTDGASDDIPALGEGMTVEDLIGQGDDKDGERNDQVCSDGIDNDGDGKIDCADIGCRFDPQITVCRGTPGIRFSMVANVAQTYNIDREDIGDDFLGADSLLGGEMDTRFTVLQLRAFGPLPGIQESFFLISGRAEKTPRLTFAMAQFPIYGGHFININSGGGGLSNALVLSNAKRLLIDAPFYVYNAFEQGNGAAVEFNGPVWPGWIDYRVYAAGGSGLFNGNIGGRFFSFDNTNYTWSTGAQLLFSPIGYVSRWDSMYLYTPVPLALGVNVGVRYDQRAQERFPAVNVSGQLRWGPFIASAESYTKYELEFQTTQTAGNVTAGLLVIPKWFMIAGDVGGFWSSPLGKDLDPEFVAATDLRRQRLEFQWRLGAHLFVYKNIGVLSAIFKDQYVGSSQYDLARNTEEDGPVRNSRELKIVAQFRF